MPGAHEEVGLDRLEWLEHIDRFVAFEDRALADDEVQRALTQGASQDFDRIDLDTNAHGRMRGDETRQRMRQQQVCGVWAEADREFAFLQPLGQRHFALEIRNLRGHGRSLLQEQITEVRCLRTMPVPGEQRQPDVRLEVPDASAERRLRDAERIGGAGKAAVLGKRRRVTDEAQVDGHFEGRRTGATSEL